MNASIEDTVRALLGRIAADADINSVRAEANLRDTLDVDSMDMLHLVVALSETFGIEIPEEHYARLSTIATTVAYVKQAMQQLASDRPNST